MTRTQDPRQFYRSKTYRSKTTTATRNPEGMTVAMFAQPVKIVGGQPTCKECGQPATEIALPSGTPVCSLHGDTRSK